MKVLSLLQPWASLVVLGHKKIETRSWNTKHRGPLMIHASQSKKGLKAVSTEMWDLFIGLGFNVDTLPYGAIIGQVSMVDTCQFSERTPYQQGVYGYHRQFWEYSKQEKAFGDYTPGRYGWLLSDPVQFPVVIPAKGGLSLWNYDLPEKIGYNLPSGGHANFDGMPDKKTVEAVEAMVQHVKQSKLF